jgi:hypothetical protein
MKYSLGGRVSEVGVYAQFLDGGGLGLGDVTQGPDYDRSPSESFPPGRRYLR